MARKQKYGIKYPFTNDNLDNVFVDVNDNYNDGIKSRLLHVLFTPKGQKLRDPGFGTNLIRFVFEQSDDITFNDLKNEIKRDIEEYVPEVNFRDITIKNNEGDDNSRIVIVHYSITGSGEITSVAIKV